MLKASVIVPAFNAEKTIKDCITALTEQSFNKDDYEIIVVDDGSTDKTAEIIQTLPVKYISKPNGGPASARNLGAKEAKGEIILFTDSDCVATPEWLAEMLKPFSDLTVKAVKGVYRTPLKSLTARFAQIEFEERYEMLKKAPSIDMIDTYSAAFRKDVFEHVGGFDESFPVANNEDTELSYKLSSMGLKMVFNPDAIVNHLGHPDSVLRYAKLKFWRGYWRMAVYKRFPGKMVKDTYTPQTLKVQILALFGTLFSLPLIPLFWHTYLDMPAVFVALVSFFGFLAVTLPFMLFSLKRDMLVGLLSPLFIALRAASIGTGVLYYAFKHLP
ncbi:glycosyltransferase [Candidatus Magnetomonas plexicatena]|uniref:glycosyltransferase n=1 Tax=Candidatus Magnetomonas plexicatena TaxID=2552947 RepID=UPI0011047E84|nr:glycosyltransferase [Nitrospirales bacterium LBB_01]